MGHFVFFSTLRSDLPVILDLKTKNLRLQRQFTSQNSKKGLMKSSPTSSFNWQPQTTSTAPFYLRDAEQHKQKINYFKPLPSFSRTTIHIKIRYRKLFQTTLRIKHRWIKIITSFTKTAMPTRPKHSTISNRTHCAFPTRWRHTTNSWQISTRNNLYLTRWLHSMQNRQNY